MNVGVCAVTLKPRCFLGVLSPIEVVSLSSELQEVPVVQEQIVAAVGSHTVETGSVREKIMSLDLYAGWNRAAQGESFVVEV